jgi:hypothetical protein
MQKLRTNQKLIEIFKDALHDFITYSQESWLEMCETRENNNELEFERLLRERSVPLEQIMQLKEEHPIDPDTTVVQMLEHFIEVLEGVEDQS